MPSPRILPQRPALAAFLAGLPSLELSKTGRRNVAARFGLTDAQLTVALAEQQKGGSRERE